MGRCSVLLGVLLLSLLPRIGSAQEHQSTPMEFRRFGELVTGRWVGDITLVTDWPGESKKKGEKLTSYEKFEWVVDQKGIEWEHFGGDNTGKNLMTWDPPTKQIRVFHVGSDGGTWQTVIWKESDTKWGWKFTAGGLVDGRSFTGAGYWLFSNANKTLHLTGDIVVGDEKLPKFDDVYTRVTK